MHAIRFLNSSSITILMLLVLATSAGASPTVSVNWGTCPFPAGSSTNRNMGVAPRDTITVTAKGLSGPVRASEVRLHFRSPGGLADAWRYDDAGCEAGRASLENASAGDACPPLLGANPQRIANFRYDDLSQMARIVYAQAFDVLNADPNVTYTLGRFTFDHSAPDPCGCLETPVCIDISYATYLDGTTNEIPFTPSGPGYLTWNDPTNTSRCPYFDDFATINGNCGPTPARAGSWGSLKASYR